MGFKDLFKSKGKLSDRRIRKAAVEKLTDQELLAKIAKNDDDYSVCVTAVEKLKDQKLLSDIALNADWIYPIPLRIQAVEKMDDQELLSNVAINVKDSSVRETAVEKVKDPEVLSKIAKNDLNGYIREKAVEKLDPNKWQELLAEIAINDSWVRSTAVKKLDPSKRQDLLAEIAKHDKDEDVRKAAKKSRYTNCIICKDKLGFGVICHKCDTAHHIYCQKREGFCPKCNSKI